MSGVPRLSRYSSTVGVVVYSTSSMKWPDCGIQVPLEPLWLILGL